ncbi:thioesterase II family protein [Couchioplanes caeruleus]|uniref:Surfactin synthase thioesterase subunit n=1 Tax=Couchioplanes caeruleus TaxID=56438 RepID=A0A3N1GM12_9ACTN|nr:alpha/beta fold hydrolase [Couchioplanes caeruleus]ROP31304.1 surfactin synthase thioesterase subunit [Couchioplanes caeruleus]
MNGPDPRWVQRYHPGPAAGVTLVCLPHAGGSASFFYPVSAALAGSIDVVAVQYPGRQDRHDEPQVSSISTLAAAVAEQVAALGPRPVALFGHSMGALVGYETALLLERTGQAPAHLFASGRRAPSTARPEAVHRLGDDALVAHVRELDGDTGVADALEDPDVRAMALPALRADYRAVETYPVASGPPLRCPITVFTGRDDPVVTAAEAAAWGGHTLGTFACLTFPGRHFFVTTHRDAILSEIQRRLTLVPSTVG